MSPAAITPFRTQFWLVPLGAALLASCGTPVQKMDLAPGSIVTPPHRMSRSEYPFDDHGRYIDAWAAEGAIRYGRFINTDRTEDGRTGEPTPERRPLPPARPPTSVATPSASKPPTIAAVSAAKPPASSSPAKKPPPKKKAATAGKPLAKKSTSHTVKKGDSLSSLSRRYGVSVQAIKRANGLKNDRIIDGRKLVIPKT